MKILTTSDLDYVTGGYEGSGCSSSDTDASCAARTDGYEACNALQSGLETAADAIPSRWLSAYAAVFADETGDVCRLAVDNYVNWLYKSQMAGVGID